METFFWEVLMMSDEESLEFFRPDVERVAAALPNARSEILEGPATRRGRAGTEMIAERMLSFLRDGR